MQRAARMIEEDRLNISEIADKLGFPSIHYFSTSFKKHWGVTPTEYRRNLKSNLLHTI
jgi:AraC-like DNA-binding protein